jgi:hypothetical protein
MWSTLDGSVILILLFGTFKCLIGSLIMYFLEIESDDRIFCNPRIKKFLLAAGLSESPAWNIAALPRRERNPNMLNPPKGRRASKRRACQAAANESWTWKQSRQAWQSQRDAGIVCKQNTKKRRASKESLTSVTSSTYWQTITIGCRRDNCCRVKKKQPSPPPNKKGDKEKKRRGWEKKECRRENERKNERETERKRMPVA